MTVGQEKKQVKKARLQEFHSKLPKIREEFYHVKQNTKWHFTLEAAEYSSFPVEVYPSTLKVVSYSGITYQVYSVDALIKKAYTLSLLQY